MIEAADFVIEVGSETVDVELPDGSHIDAPSQCLAVHRRKADGTLEMLIDAPSSDAPAG